MIGIYNTITISGHEFKRPSDMAIVREDVYKGEYTTCTGALRADRIGWKYADTTLEFDSMTPDELAYLSGLTGMFNMTWTDSDGSHTEAVIRTGFENTPTRQTMPNGRAIWRDVKIGVKFINVHSGA